MAEALVVREEFALQDFERPAVPGWKVVEQIAAGMMVSRTGGRIQSAGD
jgi:hypothetical protein